MGTLIGWGELLEVIMLFERRPEVCVAFGVYRVRYEGGVYP